MKKVLMISYQFPPDTGSIQRILNFTRYLQEYGWTPIILTHKSDELLDIDTENEFINKGIKVYRTGRAYNLRSQIQKKIDTLNRFQNVDTSSGSLIINIFLKSKKLVKSILNFIVWPDFEFWWIPFALLKSIKIIRQEKIHIVYIVTPPHSASIIGYLLKKFFNIPLILDFRDPWANNDSIIMPTSLHRISHNFFEKYIINNSSAVITTTDFHKKYFHKKIRANSKTKVYTITNGLDLQLFKSNTFTQTDNFSII